jgi:hypothetical protein
MSEIFPLLGYMGGVLAPMRLRHSMNKQERGHARQI